MKKGFAAILVAILIFATAMGAFAASGTIRQSQTIERTWSKTQESHESETHDIVSGYAARALGNFLSNDWDYAESGSWSNLSSEERAYLGTLNLSAGTRWYIDVTSHVVSSSGFSDTSYEVGREVVTEYITEKLDAYTTIITKVETTIITIKDVSYQLVLSVYDSSPLVLDLDNNGKIDVAKNDWRPHAPKFHTWSAKFFDITGDGTKDYCEWMMPAPKDGLLCIPEEGKVDTALQLFGTAGGYKDGYEKLALVCDKDNNGWVEGRELEGVKIWVDENNDAVCQPSELKDVADYNVKRISTNHKDYVSKYETTSGEMRTMWDWWPATMETRKFRKER
ncbi:MAG: hypothetical protein LWY06_18645 [Firmicutes bacterium]|nr:hypothetical protein [Bacillota bacterium]